jgi:uncharacterized protein
MTQPRLRELTLTVTERCNMRCSYCYVPVDRGRSMSPATVDAGVDLLLRHAAPGRRLDLSFFGGEPFLRPDLLERAIVRARAGGRDVRAALPTNATLLDDERLALCRTHRLDLALSFDGSAAPAERPFVDGSDSAPAVARRLPEALALAPAAKLTARLTVTPANVDSLAENVREAARLGFRSIVFLPAYEAQWTDDAVAAWGREHARIGTWLVGVYGTGRRPPDLPTWRGVEARLVQGKPRRACGAGARLVAADPEGALYPCYRFLYAEGREEFRLGTVHDGFTNHEALALFAALDPSFARPEHGDCADCEARDGCTLFCPALGFWMLRDPLAIPANACRLHRAQVAAIRPYAAVERRPATPGRSRARWAAAAMIASAVTGAAAVAACGDGDNPPTDAATDTPTGDTGEDVIGPGLCPVGADADADDDAGGPGRCPVGTDADADGDEDVIGPGVCPVGPDADADGDEDAIGPGVCPVGPDADADGDEDVIGPGMCPVGPDADADADDAGGPGRCPIGPDADADEDVIGPGMCPVGPDADADEDAGPPEPGVCPMPGLC